MSPLSRVLNILLGIVLIGASGFGGLIAEMNKGDIGHAQQGLCPNTDACSALAAEEQFWNGILLIAAFGFVAGLLLLTIHREPKREEWEEPRSPI